MAAPNLATEIRSRFLAAAAAFGLNRECRFQLNAAIADVASNNASDPYSVNRRRNAATSATTAAATVAAQAAFVDKIEGYYLELAKKLFEALEDAKQFFPKEKDEIIERLQKPLRRFRKRRMKPFRRHCAGILPTKLHSHPQHRIQSRSASPPPRPASPPTLTTNTPLWGPASKIKPTSRAWLSDLRSTAAVLEHPSTTGVKASPVIRSVRALYPFDTHIFDFEPQRRRCQHQSTHRPRPRLRSPPPYRRASQPSKHHIDFSDHINP